MDVDKAFEDLDKAEQKKIDFGAEAESFILNAKKRHATVTFGETEIKVKPVIPRDVALKIGKLEARTLKSVKKFEGLTEDDITEELIDELGTLNEIGNIAEIVSDLCIEYPFNNCEFWILFDQETDQLPQLFQIIITEINDFEKKITEFRKDR